LIRVDSSGEAADEDRVGDTAAFVHPRHDGLRAVPDPQRDTLRRARPVCRERTQVGRATTSTVADLGDRDPGRVQPADLDDRPFHRPGDQPVAAHEGPYGRDLGMHQRRHDDRWGVRGAEQELHDPRKSLSDNDFVGRGSEICELSRDLTRLSRASNLRLRQQPSRGGGVDPGEGLGRCGDDQRTDVLGLRGGLHRSLQHGLEGVGVLRPCRGTAHQVPNDSNVHLDPVEGRTRAGTSDPGLGCGRRDASPQRLVPTQLGAGRPRSVGGFGNARQHGQHDDVVSDGGHASQPRVHHVPRATDLSTLVIVIATPVALMALTWAIARVIQRRREFGSPVDRATYDTLHTASLASPHLRDGLTAQGASKAARHLRAMLGTQAVALCDTASTLAWDGTGSHHRPHVWRHASDVLASGRTVVLAAEDVACGDLNCTIRAAVLAPVISEEVVVGALAAYGPSASAGLARATAEVAGWVSTQVELAELGRQRTRTMEAELRALRAQISPHFIYNSLAAIASFVRTDPDRARELLLEFADFTRYALRRGGAFTTLAEELGNIERYLALEQARFGDRLQISLLVAPEVLSVAVPFLAIQPLVENAVLHGLESKEGIGHVSITARDQGAEAEIVVEDDGVGTDAEVMRRVLAGDPVGDSVGLGNVDARLRQVYGDDYGLVVETAVGAGTRVSFRVPKYAPGVHPSV